VFVGKKKIKKVKMKKSDRAHCKNKFEIYIIFVGAPISMIGTYGRGKHFKLCE